MRNIFILFAFLFSFLGAMGSMISMVYDLMLPVVDGPHFAIASISFVLCSIFFLFIRDDVVF